MLSLDQTISCQTARSMLANAKKAHLVLLWGLSCEPIGSRSTALWGDTVNDAWLNEPDEEGETPLSRGLSCGHEPAINLILTISEAPDTTGESAIFEACRGSRVSDVRHLIEDGANLDEPDNNGLTPLHWAAITGSLDLCKLLVNRGTHLNPRDENVTDMTPTALARWLGYEKLTQFLSDQGGLD